MSELVDYERAWLHLKAYLGQKRQHGTKELLAHMASVEVESMYAEGGRGGPDSAPPSDTEHLGADAPEPSTSTPGDPPTTPEEASWTPAAPPTPASTQTPPPLRAVSSQ